MFLLLLLLFLLKVIDAFGLVNCPPKLWRVENEVPIQLTKSLKYTMYWRILDNIVLYPSFQKKKKKLFSKKNILIVKQTQIKISASLFRQEV